LSRAEKVSIRPTAAGWICLFLLVWIPVAGTLTGNNFLFIIFGMMIGLLVVSHALARRNIASVRFSRKCPEEIFAGTRFSIQYVVRCEAANRGSAALVLKEAPPLGVTPEGIALPHAPRDGTAWYRGEATIESRGDCSIGPAVLSSSFPFGLARYVRRSGPAQNVLVFPRIGPVDARMARWGRGQGKRSERADTHGIVPHHLREYVPGDPYKQIDWKKSARTGELITRVLSDEGGGEATVRLPHRATEEDISHAASLVVHYGRMGVPVSFQGPGLFVQAGVGPEFTRQLLTILARWELPGKDQPLSAGHRG